MINLIDRVDNLLIDNIVKIIKPMDILHICIEGKCLPLLIIRVTESYKDIYQKKTSGRRFIDDKK